MTGGDVLVVEDDRDVAELLRLLLTAEGYSVRVARDGADGLRRISEQFPHLVLTDIDMPLLDGSGMVDRLFVENLGRENIPVVLLSGSPRLAEVAARVGTPYFLGKPAPPEDVIAMIGFAMRERAIPKPMP